MQYIEGHIFDNYEDALSWQDLYKDQFLRKHIAL